MLALGLGKGRSNGQEQLRQPVAGDVTAEIEQMQLDATGPQFLDYLQGVEGRPEQSI